MKRFTSVAMTAALLLLLLPASVLAFDSGDKPDGTGADTITWTGQGVSGGELDEEKCGENAGLPAGSTLDPDSYLHWILTVDGGSLAGSPTLNLGGSGSGSFSPAYDDGKGSYHFYTPFFDLATLTAIADINIATTGNGAWNLVISHGCSGGDAGADEGHVTVDKTAEATFDRTHDWSIEKTADPTSVTLYHPLSGNGASSADVDYEVVVTYDGFTDSNFQVTGTITIENDGDLAASITDIDDYLSSPEAVTVDCGDGFVLPYELAVGDTLSCSYQATLETATDGTNTVDVAGTFSDDSEIDESDTASYAFGDPENETNATVEVFDAYNGGDPVSLGTLNAADFDEGDSETFNPDSRTFTHPGGFDCTPYQVSNTATVESGEDVLDSDTATVDVTLECARRAGETATGFGPKWSLTRNAPATWFMYTTWTDIADGGADIIAGQFYDIGTITGTRNGTTSLTIDLDAGWYFANVSNNVKINPMTCGTNQNYKQPGQFAVKTTAIADVSGQNKTVTGLTNSDCYGIHLDVYQLVFYFP